MPEIETVKVKSGDGYMVINASDFDPKTHKKYTEPKPAKKPAKKGGKKKAGQ